MVSYPNRPSATARITGWRTEARGDAPGRQGGDVLTRRFGLPLAVALALAGCRDLTAPPSEPHAAGRQLSLTAQMASEPESAAAGHILQQAPAAPPLEAYQVSFWI